MIIVLTHKRKIENENEIEENVAGTAFTTLTQDKRFLINKVVVPMAVVTILLEAVLP